MVSLDLQRLKLPTDWGFVLNKLPVIANYLMVLVLASTVASLTWKLLPRQSQPEVPASMLQKKTQQVSTSTGSQPAVYHNISSWHLFGEAQQQAPQQVVEEIPEEAPDTTLALTLKGTIAGSGNSSWAIIADRGGNEETYGIDANLPGGAVLKEIYPDRVILLRNNRFETLRLPESMGTTLPGRSQRNSMSSRSSSRTPARINKPRGAVTRMGPEVSNVVKSYKKKLIDDPQSVMGVVRAEPYRRGGKLSGYRIFPGKDKELMSRVGLKPGDVVTGVNGIDLDSPLKGLEIMKQVTDAKEVSVDVLRNGVTQTFVVPMN